MYLNDTNNFFPDVVPNILQFGPIGSQFNFCMKNTIGDGCSTVVLLGVGLDWSCLPQSNAMHPLIAFDHLNLYIHNHLSQSVVACGTSKPLGDH